MSFLLNKNNKKLCTPPCALIPVQVTNTIFTVLKQLKPVRFQLAACFSPVTFATNEYCCKYKAAA
jgi:hypothetical protein